MYGNNHFKQGLVAWGLFQRKMNERTKVRLHKKLGRPPTRKELQTKVGELWKEAPEELRSKLERVALDMKESGLVGNKKETFTKDKLGSLGYAHFVKTHYKGVKKKAIRKTGTFNKQQVWSAIGEKWQNLPDKEKDVYYLKCGGILPMPGTTHQKRDTF